jgi:hypothetical protein
MEHLIEQILIKLDKKATDVAKRKFGITPEITCYELIFSIISTNTTMEAAKRFNLTQKPINAAMKKLIPNIKLTGGNNTWKYLILSLISYKECPKCITIKPIINFSVNTTKCKTCISTYNTSEIGRKYNRDYYEHNYAINPKYYLYKTEKRSDRIKLATPPWANHQLISDFYKKCPEGYHVDHIIPIAGKNVCGLHVLWNLQYLTAKDNLQKGNYHSSND